MRFFSFRGWSLVQQTFHVRNLAIEVLAGFVLMFLALLSVPNILPDDGVEWAHVIVLTNKGEGGTITLLTVLGWAFYTIS